MNSNYQVFLQNKSRKVTYTGFDVSPDDVTPHAFLFQRDIIRWACKLGRSAVFADTGMGKTLMQLEWARLVSEYTGKPVLILAPLAVAGQTIREGAKFGIEVNHLRTNPELHAINITNYEQIDNIDASQFVGIVLDESSILKNYTGKTKRTILSVFESHEYKLACSATPAPNDHLELGHHAEFLGIMPSNEMISRWFINDTMEAGGYRLKHHARADFWRWLTSWAVCISHPSDLGNDYDMDGYTLPPLRIHQNMVEVAQETWERAWENGRLFPDSAPSSTTLHKVKRESLELRVNRAVKIVATIPEDEPIILWCDTNYEADALIKAFPDAIEVRGNDKPDVKEQRLLDFTDGKIRILITKPKIAGFGLNWQHCHYQLFVGISFSFELTYQAIKRTHRFGQNKPVETYLIYSESTGNVMATLERKQNDFDEMQQEMNEAMKEHGLFRNGRKVGLTTPDENLVQGEGWQMYLGDCVEVTAKLPDNSIDFCIHSPPFANLYIYSDSEADMGNAADDDEFFTHYRYLIKELYRTMLPGRLVAVHCKDLPAYMNREGRAGLIDFPGEIIRAFESEGFQYHSRVLIWKDPVIEMQRTKNHGLLHKNFKESAEAVRQGMPDYLVVFRKWPLDGGEEVKQNRVIGDYIGTNPPTVGEYAKGGKRSDEANYSIAVWQRYASPVWFDIDQTNVLNYRQAKVAEDEKHICPLQLDVVARAVDLWTNPGDVVFSPFAGIGSEGYEALKLGRQFIGVELKPEYHKWACKYLDEAAMLNSQPTLFDGLDFG